MGAKNKFAIALAIASTIATYAAESSAHNEIVHQKMTDIAYHILLSIEKHSMGQDPAPVAIIIKRFNSGPDSAAFLAAAASTASKIRLLPCGLKDPVPSGCQWVSSGEGSLKNNKFGLLRHPVAYNYSSTSDCGIDAAWHPGGIFDLVNPPDANQNYADYTGPALGYWALTPDEAIDDVHMFIRPTNAAGMSKYKEFIYTLAAAYGVDVLAISFTCALTCLGSFLTAGLASPACTACATAAAQAAASGAAAITATVIDLTGFGFGDHDAGLYVGMNHLYSDSHSGTYDDRRGMYLMQPGPWGTPDVAESLVSKGADALGWTVHYDTSDGPKNYQMNLSADGQPRSVPRGATDWEFRAFPHIEFHPLDNLGMYGWQFAEASSGAGAFRYPGIAIDNTQSVRGLGWTLHAFGDATVPMHASACFGWGHQPYEFANDALRNEILGINNNEVSTIVFQEVLTGALAYWKSIQEWRSTHASNDIPVRDLIAKVAHHTYVETPANMYANASASFQFMALTAITAADLAQTLNGYMSDPAIEFFRSRLVDGIAAQVAFLVAAMEVLQ